MLAAARTAALYDRDLIMQADAQLRRLEAEIGNLTATMQGKQHEALIAAARDIANQLPDFEQQLAEIAKRCGIACEDYQLLAGEIAKFESRTN